MSQRSRVGALSIALCVAALLLGTPAAPQSPRPTGADANAVRISGGALESGGLWFVNELAKRIAARQETGPSGELAVRVVPVIGRGGIHDIRELLSDRSSMDLVLTNEQVLNELENVPDLRNLRNRVVYLARLFYEELHIVGGPGITQLSDLAGKPVNVGEYGSGAESLIRGVLKALDIAVVETHLDQEEAFRKVQDGTLAATAILADKPLAALTRLPRESGLRLLSIPYPAQGADGYFPGTLTAEDYPNLVPTGDSLSTVMVRTVMVARNWPQGTRAYRQLQEFVNLFFPSLLDLRRPTWTEAGLAEPLPGWTRFGPAERWLRRWQVQDNTGATNAGPSAPPASERQRLFEEFLRWKQKAQP
jgi:TRAP-type uncharacterized transport system substrate-binding protein